MYFKFDKEQSNSATVLTIGDTTVTKVQSFKYLGSTLSCDETINIATKNTESTEFVWNDGY